MREIKFRGRCLESGTWIYGSLFNSIWRKSVDGSRVCYIFPDNMLDDDDGGGDCWEDFAEVAEQYEVDPATVGQYTGLKDKNGKEIYEGDIVHRSEPYSWYADGAMGTIEEDYEVSFSKNIGFGWLPFIETGFGISKLEGQTMNFTIIGNIHDNPELLKTEHYE